MNKYWLVHNPGTSARHMYTSFAEAVCEANLLNRSLGQTFVVLESLCSVGEPEPLPRLEAIEDADEPF